MTIFKTFTGTERAALHKHGLDIRRPSQLSDAFVLGMRHAASIAAELDCAHRCGVGAEIAAKLRGNAGVALPRTDQSKGGA
jgi:hypothetical protein